MLTQRSLRMIGREAELRALDELVSSESPHTLLLTGEPGIGKTTLWDAGVDVARTRGMRVLAARASDAETNLSGAALVDLLDGIGREEAFADEHGVVDDALAHLVCSVEQTLRVADHTIFVGGVREAWRSERAATPLLYHRRAYRRLATTSARRRTACLSS